MSVATDIILDIYADAAYDGDAESVVVRKIKRAPGENNIEMIENVRPKGKICNPPTTTLPPSAMAPLQNVEESSDVSRALFSAAIKVSKLQASFAEKTAEDMEQIVNWYNKYRDGERFVKVNQSESLPDNAIVYDSLHSHDPAGNLNDPSVSSADDFITASSPSQSSSSDASWVTPTSSPTASTKSNVAGDPSTANTPVRSNRIALSSSLSPSVCSEEVRQQLETADHLIRITQYMAEVVVELEQTSSSSDMDRTISVNHINDTGLEEAASIQRCDVGPPEIVRRTRSTHPSPRTRGAHKRLHMHAYQSAKTIAIWIVLPLVLSSLMFIFLRKQDLSVSPNDEYEIPTTVPTAQETMVVSP
jgi:hypothetical protein